MNSTSKEVATHKLVLQARGLGKIYRQGPQKIHVLRDLNFDLARGERVAILGTSGSGKSTLLNLLGGLDTACSGEVEVLGKDFSKLSELERGKLRNKSIGFVYQFHHLLPEFSALENVSMPLLIGGISKNEASAKATDLLRRVGLEARLEHRPSELSGGERQRVAIARALACDPQCVLMDEPTGNLDHTTADAIHQLMETLNTELGTSFVVVTHDPRMAAKMDRQLQLVDGRLIAAGLAGDWPGSDQPVDEKTVDDQAVDSI